MRKLTSERTRKKPDGGESIAVRDSVTEIRAGMGHRPFSCQPTANSADGTGNVPATPDRSRSFAALRSYFWNVIKPTLEREPDPRVARLALEAVRHAVGFERIRMRGQSGAAH